MDEASNEWSQRYLYFVCTSWVWINRLVKKGFLTSKPYRSIHLTKKGKFTADLARERHKIVYDFLISLGIDKETAELDSEGIEHHVGNKTLNKLKNLTVKLQKK